MEFTTLLKTRRSTRSYKPEQITTDELEKVLLAGCAAPVGNGAYETIHMTVIQDAKLLSRIADEFAKAEGKPGSSPFYGAPTVVVISSSRKDSPVAFANAGCIVENMALAATDEGIGSVYLFGFLKMMNSHPELIQALNLPEGFAPISGITLGYPMEPLLSNRELTQRITMNRI